MNRIADPARGAFSRAPESKQEAGRHERPHGWMREFGEHFLRALPVLVLLTILGQVFERSGLFESVSAAVLDTFLQTRAPKILNEIVVLEISDEDYKEYFGGHSPLDPKSVADFVNTIDAAKPTAVGVDLDTSDVSWCQLPASAIPASDRIMWAELPVNNEQPLQLGPVVGGQFVDLRQTGIPRFPLDPDGLVRKYVRRFPIRENTLARCTDRPAAAAHIKAGASSASASLDSLATAIVKKWCAYQQSLPAEQRDSNTKMASCARVPSASDQPVIFSFQGGRYHLLINDAHDFLLPALPDPKIASEAAITEAQRRRQLKKDEVSQRLPLLTNKMVLIGGSYAAARDNYFTPTGEKAGVELVGEAIATEMQGNGVSPVSRPVAVMCDLLVGITVIVIYFVFRENPQTALLVSLGLIPALLLTGPWLSRTGYWLDVSTIIVGLILDQMFELSGKVGEYRKKCTALEQELKKLRSSAAELPLETDAAGVQVERPDGDRGTEGAAAPPVVVSAPQQAQQKTSAEGSPQKKNE